MARNLVFQGVNILDQNELKLTYKRLYLEKICRELCPRTTTKKAGWERRRGEGKAGEEGTGRGEKGTRGEGKDYGQGEVAS
jgi:hypothetical protein